MKTEVNDCSIWNEIYEKENFKPGWSSPGTDYNLKRIISAELEGSGDDVIDILDIGCGNGRNSMIVEELSEFNFNYTGADFAQSALEYCKNSYVKSKSFVHVDITADDLPLNSGYRVIMDCGCFHSIPLDKRLQYKNSLKKLASKESLIVIGAWYRAPEHNETVRPSYFPYLYLDEWFFNRDDMQAILGDDFIVEDEFVDSEIYDGINCGFAYFTIRLK